MDAKKPDICPHCENTGFYRTAALPGDPHFGEIIRCECRAAKDALRWQRLFNIPIPKFQGWESFLTQDRPGTVKMIAAGREYLEHIPPTGWLTIWGVNGTGKTMTLHVITNISLGRNIGVLYITAFGLIAYLKAGIGDEDNGVVDRLRMFEKIPLLCLDELAAIRWTDWVAMQFEELFDHRYAEDMPTILAMDTDPQKFFSQRLYSRINEMGAIIHNGDPDMRLTTHAVMDKEGDDHA